MMFADVARLVFIVLWGISILGFVASIVRFQGQRKDVKRSIGPLPTPIALLNVVALAILLLRVGEIGAVPLSAQFLLPLVGLVLSIYGLVMLVRSGVALDRFGVPGAAILEDHNLITEGPFGLVRHPGYSAYISLWLGTALVTLNWILMVMWPFVTGLAYLASRPEEQLLREEFGQEYVEYAEGTNRFIPGLW